MENSLQSALERLKAFRSRFSEGDLVEEGSGLTADDLTAIIDYCDRPAEDVVAEALGGFA